MRSLVPALVLLAAVPAGAVVEGAAPSKVSDWRLFGSHSATGAALMSPGPFRAEINSVLLASSTAQITDMPFDHEVAAAYLFWSGAAPRTFRDGPSDPPDRDCDFTVADGTTYNDLSVDSDPTGFGRCVTTTDFGGFYYCRRDVTDLVALQGPGNANGIYEVGDVDADAGAVNPGDPQYLHAQAKYAGWTLVIVWRAPSVTVRRDVVLYDGFIRIDEDPTSSGLHTFDVDGFLVGTPALGKLTLSAFEGDRQLGVPPQDSTGCPLCYDFISFQAQSASSATKLSDGANPQNNSFNSSWNGQASIDIDTYNLSGLVRTGDARAAITLGSGDGVPSGDGGGESIWVGWVLMTIDTLTPSFSGNQTKISVAPTVAGGGSTLYYTIDVVNQGSLGATGVVVQAAIPAGSAYVPGSTRVDGVPRADSGGTSALVAGLSLGNIPTAANGDNTRQITFAVTVESSACGGSVSASAAIRSNETDPATVGPAVTSIQAPSLEVPTKTVGFISAPPDGPGSTLSYTIRIANSGSQAAGGVSVSDVLPPEIVVSTVFGDGAWSVSGGTLTVSGLDVPANDSSDVVVVARVRTVAELAAIGIAEDQIDGRLVLNQATVSGGCAPPQLTDDPALAGDDQPTAFTLTYAPVLSTSVKSVSDENGAPLEPNDFLAYSIRVVNSGNRTADVVVKDVLPAYTSYVPASTRVDGTPVADSAGASPLVAGLTLASLPFSGDNDRVITFRVRVDPLAPSGSSIANRAELSVPAAPSADLAVTSPALTVVAAPELVASRKSVVPQALYRPGDVLTYHVVVDNSGNRPATDVVVTDTLSADLRFVSASNGGSFAAGTVSWSLPVLLPDSSVTLTLEARIVSPLDNGRHIANAATIDCAELPPLITPPVEIVVTSSPTLVVTKVDEHPSLPPRPGDAVTYRIRIENRGDMVARDVVLSDPLDASLGGVAAPSGRVGAADVTWDAVSEPRLAALAPGDPPVELLMTAVIDTPLADGTQISNQASATPLGAAAVLSDDPETTAAGDPTLFGVSSQARLAFAKAVADLSPATPALPGDRVRYTLTLTASGDAPTRNLSVSDTADSALTAIDASASGGTVSGGVVTWSIPRLDPGQSRQLTFEASIAAGTADGTVVSNQARAQSGDLAGGQQLSDGDVAAAGDQPTRFTVVSRAVLVVQKSVALEGDDDPAFNPGDRVRYTLDIANVGTAAAAGVTASDPLDSRLTVVDAGGGRPAGGTLSWSSAEVPGLASIAAGSRLTLTFSAAIASPLDDQSSIANQATVASPSLSAPVQSDDPALAGLSDPTVFVVRSSPRFDATTKVAADITGDPLVTRPGDELRYTVTVTNSGDSDADSVEVRDPLPANTTLVSVARGRVQGGVVIWDATTEPALARLAAGGSVSVSFVARVVLPLANGTAVANQAIVRSQEVPTPAPSDDPATARPDDPTTVVVSSASDLGASVKRVTDLTDQPISTARPNQVVRYHIAVANRGDSAASSVTVSDDVPGGLAITSAPGGTVTGQRITWGPGEVPALASIAPGARVDLTVDVQLAGTFTDGQLLANQALVSAEDVATPIPTDGDPTTVAKEQTLLTVRATPRVAATKLFRDPFTGATLAQARPGQVVQVAIELANTGDGMARNVAVTDALDSSILTSLVVRDGGTLAGSTASWSLPTLLPGETRLLRVAAQVRAPLDPVVLSNQGAFTFVGGGASALTDDPTRPGVSDATLLEIVGAPDFEVTKSVRNLDEVAPGMLRPNDRLEFTIGLTNRGNGVGTDVAVRDPLDALGLVEPQPGTPFRVEGAELVFDSAELADLAAVAPGERVDLVFMARVAPGAPDGLRIENQAFLTAIELASAVASNQVAVVVAYPELTIGKSVLDVDGGDPEAGDVLRYTLTVRNGGSFVARNVAVTDVLDAALDLTGTAPPATQSGRTLTWQLGDLAPDAAGVVTVEAVIAAGTVHGTIVRNRARAVGELAPSVESPEVSLAVVSEPDFRGSEKRVLSQAAIVGPGDLLTYEITVRNDGSGGATGTLVTDTVDPWLEILPDVEGGTVSGRTVTWSLEDLPIGAEAVVSFVARVRDDTPSRQVIANTALVRSDQLAEPQPTSTATVTVVAEPSFAGSSLAVADVNGGSVQPGDLLRYALWIKNSGTIDATGALVRLPLPPYAVYVPGSTTLNGEPVGEIGSDAPLSGGLAVRSAGALPGVIFRDDGLEPDNEAALVSFDVRVDPRVLPGTLIAAQATLLADAAPPTGSDDPATPALGDPTAVVVGGGAELVVMKHVERPDGRRLALGEVASVGERLRYALELTNSGDAPIAGVLLDDAVPAGASLVPDSLRLDGAPVTDARDGDAGEVVDGKVLFVAGDLAPLAQRAVSFEVVVAAGPHLANQAVAHVGGRSWLSDGDATSPGVQPTLTPVDAAAEVVAVALAGSDLDGGVLRPGDRVRFSVVLRNEGAATLEEAAVTLALSDNLLLPAVIDPGRGRPESDEPPVVRIGSLAPGEATQIEIEAQARPEATAGEVVTALAEVSTTTASFVSEAVSMIVGGGAGTSGISGRIFWDRGGRDGLYDASVDGLLEGFSIEILPASPREPGREEAGGEPLPIRAIIPEPDGSYAVPGLPPGLYEVWAKSSEGARYAHSAPLELRAGQQQTGTDFAIDPSGIVYQERDGVAVAMRGARIFLVDIDDTSAGSEGTDLDPTLVFGGQQGQTTTAQGFYRFDVRAEALPRRLRIRIEPPGPELIFPSELRPPIGRSETDPWGAPAVVGPDGRVVPNDLPDLSGDTTYFLRFDLSPSSVSVTNNHIPLDSASQRIRLSKTVDRRTAEIGEIIGYTVTISNPTSSSFPESAAFDPAAAGVVLIDDMPDGVELVTHPDPDVAGRRAVRASLRVFGTGAPRESELRSLQLTSRQVKFAPFSLPARSTAVIRYFGVVGIRARGEQTNRAHLQWGNTAISNEDSATVRIIEDPIFDQGTVLGRVLCEAAPGATDSSERGLAGARVYLDSGNYVESDMEGKFHLRGVSPGRHALKLDLNTVPPGSVPLTDPLRVFYTSRGLLTKIDFVVGCNLETVRPQTVTLKAPPPPPPRPTALVIVNPKLPAIALEGAAQALPLVDAVLTPVGVEPDFASGLGTELAELGKLTWHIAAPSRTRLLRWQISIFDTMDFKEVWRVQGEGRPPPRVPWDLVPAGSPLAPGRIYVYRISAATPEGDLGEGRWRRLHWGAASAAAAGAKAGADQQLALWSGNMFEEEGDAPSRQLIERVKALAAQLIAAGSIPELRIEVHTDNGGKRSAKLLWSQRQAVAVAKLFVEAGLPQEKLAPLGKGDTQPLVPSINRKAKLLNRRIVVKRVSAAAPLPADLSEVAPLAYPALLSIADRAVSLTSERIESELEVDVGQEIAVDFRELNGRRVRIVRKFPFQAVGTQAQEPVRVELSGSLPEARLRVGSDDVRLSLLGAGCRAEGGPFTMEGDKLAKPVRFVIDSDAAVSSWLVRLFNPAGTVLTDLSGSGMPPAEGIAWAGTSAAGASVVRNGQYGFRCMLTDGEGSRAVTALQALQIGAAATAAAFEQTLKGAEYPRAETLAGQGALDRIAAAVTASSGARLEIEVHDTSEGGKMQAQIRTARLAKALQDQLIAKGVSAEAIDVGAYGATRPAMVGTSRKALEQNRRVVLRVKQPAEKSAAATPEPPHVRVDGEELVLGADGGFAGTVVTEHDATLVLDLLTADGRSAVYNIPLFEGRILGATSAVVPQGFVPEPGAPLLGGTPRVLVDEPSPAAPEASAAPSAPPPIASAAKAPAEPTALPEVDAIAGWVEGMTTLRQDAAVATAGSSAVAQPAERSPVLPTTAVAGANGVGPSKRVAAAKSVTVPLSEAPAVLAADLYVDLPPDGAELSGERLTVRGQADHGNRVRVNGKVVPLDELGRFIATLDLPPGELTVEVTAEDREGNVARAARSYVVPRGEWFFLGMADLVAGWGERLEGAGADGTRDFGHGFYGQGRGVAYLKARLDGDALVQDNPFDTIRITGHIDSGKEEDRDVMRQLIDPERYYPAYGDTSEEVQDARSRAKGYLRVDADRSQLVVGNFQTSLNGGELFRYQRSHFGGSLKIDEELVRGHRTELQAFASAGDSGVEHRELMLQGTGGSLYFLRDTALIEGSERIALVVRDAVTAERLLETVLSRDIDYTIDYRDGRVSMAQPIPSTVVAGWRLGQNPTRAMEGHPIFIEVDYDFDASGSFERGGRAFAGQLRQTFYERVTVGAGMLDEDRRDDSGGHYRLYGAELRVKLLERTSIDAEVAMSELSDQAHLVSLDGGITYGRIGAPDRGRNGERGGVVPAEPRGWAARLRVAGDAQEYLAAAGQGTEVKLPFTLYAQHQEPSFYAGTAVFEQGQSKAGGQLRAELDAKNRIRLRHDGVLSWVYLPAEDRRIVRHVSTAGFEHQEKGWLAGIEAGNVYGHDAITASNTTGVSLFGDYELLPRLVGSLEQEAIVYEDSPLIEGYGDRLATTAGARYQLAESLWLVATEQVHWSGTNSTQLGIRTRFADDLSLYATERLTAGDGRSVSTTVVGAESSAIAGTRSYAEYQLDSLAAGRSGRAVFGMDNRWSVAQGLTLHLSYERAQLVGDRQGATLTGSAISDPRVAGNGTGPLARDQQFAASGFDNGAVFPAGVSSRDAFAVGVEWLRSSNLKAGARFEMRYDRGDAELGAADRLVLFGRAGGDWRFYRGLVALLRLQAGAVRNLDPDLDRGNAAAFDEAQFLDLSCGFALRPVHSDAFGGLMKWTRRFERVPLVEERTQYQLRVSDVLSLEPYYELGLGFQLVGKLALKIYELRDEALPEVEEQSSIGDSGELPLVRSTTALAILRLNYHLTSAVDAALEYRWLTNVLAEEVLHGALAEIAWIPVEQVSVGVGYNFSRFSDDLLANPNGDSHGFFFRVTGRY